MILGILFLILIYNGTISSVKIEKLQNVTLETLKVNQKIPLPTAILDKEIRCLAKNIYFEARNEPTLGQIAVAFVTLNRVDSNQFPDTICTVVEQKTQRICQFSWYCESRPHYLYRNDVLTLRNDPVYNRIHDLAVHVYKNHYDIKDPTKGSLFYHANYVDKSKIGVKNLKFETIIGRHIFYSLNT
jgi:spore germination cell wall hydrolase CwlJ-like protein